MKETSAAFQLNEHDHRRKVEVRVGQVMELRLQENPTAGFRWRILHSGEPVCSLVADVFQPGRKKPGQPGIHCWRFKIVAKGKSIVELAYGRAWEARSSPAQVFSLGVNSAK